MLYLGLRSQSSNDIYTRRIQSRSNLHHSCKNCILRYYVPVLFHSYRGLQSFIFNVTLTLPITKNSFGSVLASPNRVTAHGSRNRLFEQVRSPPRSAPPARGARLIQSLRTCSALVVFFFEDECEVLLHSLLSEDNCSSSAIAK